MVLRVMQIRIGPFFRCTVLLAMNSRRVFYRFSFVAAAVLLSVWAFVPAFAQGEATPAQQQSAPSPSDSALTDAEAARAQAMQNEPALPDMDTVHEQAVAQQTPAAQSSETAQTPAEAAPVPMSDPSVDPAYEAAVEKATGDALPVSRMRINAEGFGLAADRHVTVYPGDNPADEVDNEALQQEIRQEAFDAATTGLFPLAPEDIRKLLKQYDDTERAAQSPPYDLPTPEVVVQTVSMDPGVPPPVIKTAVGHVTTVNMLDMTGAPWPVQDITWAGDFEIVEPEEGGHIIRITPMAKFTYGNMSVRLLTLKTPITFTLRVERDSVHYRVDARVPEFGPFANAQIMEGGAQLEAGNSTLTTVLDGVPPTGAVRLAVSGVDGRTTAYKVGGTTYVRTPLTLLSPGWQSSVSSADGMNVYAMDDTPVLLLSDQGRFMRAKLTEERNLFDEQ
jgi:intracellular multiplication protein IcmK